MDPTGRIHVDNGQGEEDPPGQGCEPPPDLPARPLADDVIPGVDRLQERVEVRRRPGLGGRRDDDDRLRAVRQPLLQRPTPPDLGRADHECIGPASTGGEEIEQPLGDRVEVDPLSVVHDDHQDIAVRDRIAERGGVERVNPVVAGGRRPGRVERPHDSSRVGRIADCSISDFRRDISDFRRDISKSSWICNLRSCNLRSCNLRSFIPRRAIAGSPRDSRPGGGGRSGRACRRRWHGRRGGRWGGPRSWCRRGWPRRRRRTRPG